MKILLLQHVKGLGQKGEIKEVSEGYFRNSLLPKKLASIASDSQLKHVNAQKEKAFEKLQNMKESALSIKSKIHAQVLILKEKASNAGKLYASVSAKELATAIQQQFNVEIPVKSIQMPDHIKQTGEFEIIIDLHKGVQAKITLNVQPE